MTRWILQGERIATPQGIRPAAALIEGEKIAAVGAMADMPADCAVVNAGALAVLPGLVDPHVHINDPGRSDWEGFATATRAAASGGFTMLVDMPLNCLPETTTVEALEVKHAAATDSCFVDWAAWGGAVADNQAHLKPLARAGVPGYKCFLIYPGIEGFTMIHEPELRRSLPLIAETGLPLLVHAELSEAIDEATKSLADADWRRYATYLASRPDEAELAAIRLMITLAEETGAHIHIVHLATAQALPLLTAARLRGLKITVETCEHYLTFAAEEIPDGATEFKCAPPIRSAENRELLWQGLMKGEIDFVTSDHSPCPPAMKGREAGHFGKAWGGIATLGLALPVLWTGMKRRGIALDQIIPWLATGPARLAGVAGRKGSIATGADADFVLFDDEAEWTISQAELHFQHKISPYLGRKVNGRVHATYLRGACIYQHGRFPLAPAGKEQR